MGSNRKSEQGFIRKLKGFFGAGNEKDNNETVEYDYEADHEKDILRIFMLCHRDNSMETKKFKDAFIRAQEIDLRTKEMVLSESKDLENTAENSQALLEYMKDMSGVLVICSTGILDLLNKPSLQQTNVDLQINGDDALLDAEILSNGIKDSNIIKRKVLLLKQPNDIDSIPSCIDKENSILLSDSNLDRSDKNKTLHEIWLSDNIMPHLKKITFQRRVSQSSIGN
eukprot:gene306-935_t